MFPLRHVLIIAFFFCPLAKAADDSGLDPVRFADLRLLVGPGPGTAKTTLTATDSSFQAAATTRWDRSTRIALMWLPWPGRADEYPEGMWALELAATRMRADAQATSTGWDVHQFDANFHLGMAWIPWRYTTWETTAFAGPGLASAGSGNGPCWQVGLRTTLVCTLQQGLQGGLSLDWRYGETRFRTAADGRTFDALLVQQGVAPALVLGWRF
jgi:hypothetical protein